MISSTLWRVSVVLTSTGLLDTILDVRRHDPFIIGVQPRDGRDGCGLVDGCGAVAG